MWRTRTKFWNHAYRMAHRKKQPYWWLIHHFPGVFRRGGIVQNIKFRYTVYKHVKSVR